MDLFNINGDVGLQALDSISFMKASDVFQLLWRFLFNYLIVWVIIHFFYYPKSRRRDYYVTFTLINVSVFLLVILMGSVNLKIGFALGIFAIFGIIRYRTETVAIREMTYLFVIIAISVINAFAIQINPIVMVVANVLFILSVWLIENEHWLKHISCKLVLYDKVHLITPDKREELIADLQKRIGIEITKIEIGHIDFLRDAVFIKVFYESKSREMNTVDLTTSLPKEDF